MRVGLIGYPVKHSISPAFQQAAFDAAGIAARYEAWETPPEQLAAVVAALRRSDCLGANVTIPHKSAVQAYLDRVDPVAAAIGAVNTIVREGEALVGYNTDASGFARALRDDANQNLRGASLGVVGAGGAARAVVAAALAEGAARITLVARRLEAARSLLDDLAGLDRTGAVELRAVRWIDAEAALRDCDVLVNTTPVGMAHRPDEDQLPIPVEILRPTLLVCDLIYNPPRTRLLQVASQRGARTLNGLPMLVYQGAAAWERWTGRSAPVDLMRRVAEEALGLAFRPSGGGS